MHPMVGKLFAECHCLSALVFVMWEAQVGTTTMQIKTLTQ